MYGRGDDWQRLVEETTPFLEERAATDAFVTYGELNGALVERTGLPPLDFSQDRDRAAVGALLWEAVDRTFAEAGAMISAIMIRREANDPGPGFYELAVEKGLLEAGASPERRTEFWLEQAGKVRAHYRRAR